MSATPVPPDRELLVRSLTWEADGVLGVELVDPTGADLPEWRPGAHIDLVLPGEVSRQYSLCGDPADRRSYRLGVLREAAGRGGSAYVHDALRPGQRLTVRGPRNHFRLEPSPAYLFVAGGIGITPILTMIAEAEAAGADWTLLYGGRTAASMAYTERLAAYGERVALRPQDVHGLLDLDALLGTPRPDTLVYCCGPEPLIAAVEERCAAAWPAGSLHVERFAAPEPVELDPSREHAISLVLKNDGRTLPCRADQSILAALREGGIEILSDCEDGICGTCEVGVVEGEVDHRDYVLTDAEKEENEFMMVCVSRARGDRLVLDL